jgi:hypothetical protein
MFHIVTAKFAMVYSVGGRPSGLPGHLLSDVTTTGQVQSPSRPGLQSNKLMRVTTMVDDDNRLKAARLRQNLREIDARVAEIRADQRLFRRFKFGSDVQDIELTGLRANRADLVDQLDALRSSSGTGRSRLPGLRSWLLLPIALGAEALREIQPSGQKTRTSRASTLPSNLDGGP